MAENDVEENVFPTDWDGLSGYDDVMAGLPEMVQAESFSPSQTALFAVVERRLNERLLVMRDGGVFGGKAKKTVSDDAVAVAMAEYVEIADPFYKGLAVNADAYAEWTKGRGLFDLLNMFASLTRFYVERLGKSSASKKQSRTAE
ncbi:hypothetical protein [Bifidobacterium longum]|uniref:hypothetical protein n=1 Tax=Bifidobacterium longum TaxID=216816 RepID=UPI00205899F0|nr:MAG TPA: hypothetical protein [Caudoviricetes sp.]